MGVTAQITKKNLVVCLSVLLFVGMAYDFINHPQYPELNLAAVAIRSNCIVLRAIDGFTDAETVEFNIYPKEAPEPPLWKKLTHYAIKPGVEIPLKSDCLPETTYIMKIRHIGTRHLYLDTEVTTPPL
ncbi:MAG: hypothetical protein OEW43_00675 [Elusimicrobiota bacterium]|nr:hypothetical protein [Elusimicrobiota bacterium]MDH5661566.1 hypothetical protein [Elusimicrobiota bacterium]